MATSKGRSGATSKSAAKKATKSTGKSRSSASANKSVKQATAKKSAPAKAVAAKKSTATKASASKKITPAKKSAPASSSRSSAARKGATTTGNRNGSASASAASRGRATAASASKKTASRSTSARGVASSRSRGKATTSADPRNDLAKILQDLMQDIYYAEKKLVKAIGKMAKNATSEKLKEAFVIHQSQTQEQVAKLESAFEALGQKPKAKKCAAMDGLLEECDEHIEEYEKGAGLDAALVVGAQKVEHYEIASYGSMRSIAHTLGYKDAARIFEEIREQESDTDELLTQLAESVINLQAEEETENVDESKASPDDKGGKSGNESKNDDNDGAGRGISSRTDGNDRGEKSETGEAMGH